MRGGITLATDRLLNSTDQIAMAALITSAYRLEAQDVVRFVNPEGAKQLMEVAIRFTREGGPETRDDERERVVACVGGALLDAGAKPQFLESVTVRDLVPRKPSELKGEYAAQKGKLRVIEGLISWVESEGVTPAIAQDLVTKLLVTETERIDTTKAPAEDDLTLGELVRVVRARAKRRMRRS